MTLQHFMATAPLYAGDSHGKIPPVTHAKSVPATCFGADLSEKAPLQHICVWHV